MKQSFITKAICSVSTLLLLLTFTSCNSRQARVVSKILHEVDHATDNNDNDEDFSVTVGQNIISTSSHDWVAISVQGNSSYTIVVKQCYPKVAPSWICSTGSEFIEDVSTGERYYLTGSDIGVGRDNRTDMLKKEPYSFNEYYPAIPSNVTHINISSGSNYYITNVRIR